MDQIVGEVQQMSVLEWRSLVERAKLIDDQFTLRETRLCFVRAQETAPDEQVGDSRRVPMPGTHRSAR
jgi:hypothetical protein